MTGSTSSAALSLERTTHGVLWNSVSVYAPKILVFATTVVLARLLDQKDFGLFSHALIALSIIRIVQSWGLQQALVYFEWRRDRASTALGLSVLFGVLTFGLTWLISPAIGTYFKSPESIPLVRTLAITLIISAFETAHFAYIQKELNFRRKVLPELSRSFVKGILSVGLALSGWKAWSLIGGHVAGGLAAVVLVWVLVPWRPEPTFKLKEVGALLRYGGKLTANNVLSIFMTNVDSLFVGRLLGVQALGLYTLAFRLPELAVKELGITISQAVFPTLVRWREEGQDLHEGFLKTVRLISVVTLPVGAGLALLAKPVVLIAFGEKWVDAWQVTQAIAIFAMLRSIVVSFGDLYLAQGRHIFLVYQRMGLFVITLPVLWIAAGSGLVTVAWAQVALAALGLGIHLLMARRLLAISAWSFLSQLIPAARGLLTMTIVVAISKQLVGDPLVQLLVGVVTGAAAYMGTLYLLDRSLVMEASQLLGGLLRRK
jgi:O-antigen/teichoic acid export membrane protein